MQLYWLLFTAGLASLNLAVLTQSEPTKFGLTNTRASELDWWQTAVFYQIYPRSFMDSNNDGIGDLQGIISKLDHLKDMGVTATWLSPIFKSPQVDQGYDISDYYDVDPSYGTVSDLRQLVDKAHQMGIKVILDFVPNHTSDQHEWFKASVNGTEEYKDYYVWKDCTKKEDGTVIPPNNWISTFKDSAWEYNEKRGQCYLHQFAIAQPDLNYNNPKVVEAMKDVLRYWMNFGIDGFRCDAVNTLFEDPDFRDEPLSNLLGANKNEYNYLLHIYTTDQEQTYDMIYQWRTVLDEFTKTSKTDAKVMMTEAYTTVEKTMLYYGTSDGSRKGAHFTFNFNFIRNLTKNFDVNDLQACIEKWLLNIPTVYTSNWVMGNHDNHRVASRFGKETVDAFNMLNAFLPGVMVTYNGEEIGMEDGGVQCSEGKDPWAIKNCTDFDAVSRDFERTPYQWNNSVNAGFNAGHVTWLPVSKKANETNLASQNIDGVVSHYNIYKKLLLLRNNFKNASELDTLSIVKLNDKVIELIRKTDSNEFLLIFNTGDKDESIDFYTTNEKYEVVVTSVKATYKIGDIISSSNLKLGPYDSLILHNTKEVINSSGNKMRLMPIVFIILFFKFIFLV